MIVNSTNQQSTIQRQKSSLKYDIFWNPSKKELDSLSPVPQADVIQQRDQRRQGGHNVGAGGPAEGFLGLRGFLLAEWVGRLQPCQRSSRSVELDGQGDDTEQEHHGEHGDANPKQGREGVDNQQSDDDDNHREFRRDVDGRH